VVHAGGDSRFAFAGLGLLCLADSGFAYLIRRG